MVLKEITYFINGKRRNIKVEICDTLFRKFRGLMFRKNPKTLLFVFNKEKTLSIHSFFCTSFRAIWLDNNMKSTKIVDVKDWRLNISGRGRFLLEIPATTIK